MDLDKITVAGRPLVRDPRLLEETSRHRPLFLLKMALSLDGKIAPVRKNPSDKAGSFYVSNQESRRLVHRIRENMDGVMVGAETIRSDNPRLDCRLTKGRNPYKIVVTSAGDLPPRSNIFNCEPEKVIIASTDRITKRKKLFEEIGAAVIICREEKGRVDLGDLSARLRQKKINSVLLEGGAELAASALKKNLIDRVMFFYAPLIMGGGSSVESVGNLEISDFSGIMLEDVKIRRLKDNFLIDGYPDQRI